MKDRHVLVTFIAACATVCIMTPSVAQAANTTCVNADFIYLGQMASYTLPASGDLFFKTHVTAGRSYALMAWGPFQDAGEGGVNIDLNEYSDSACSTSYPTTNSTNFEPSVAVVPAHVGDGDTLIPNADGNLYLRLTNFVAVAYTVNVLVVESTLFSPWWFTGGTNQAYVEVRNNMNMTTTANLTVYRANGTICGTSNPSIPANGNAAIEINTVGTCAAALSGSAQIAFNGTAGGLTANITTINVPNGTSFDSPFTPRMVWGTFTR